jgi:NADH-quinone oxidoreductase subunit N
MTGFDARVAFPLLVLAATPVVALLALAVRRSHVITAAISLVGLVVALLGLIALGVHAPERAITPLLTMDAFAVFGLGLLLLATLAVVLLSYDYLGHYAGWREEYYVLLLVATLGAAVIVASNHFAAFFLGLETLSISLYALIAFFPRQRRPLEAGLKYLVLAATTAAFLLFGMALVYGETGSLRFDGIVQRLSTNPELRPILVLPGLAFILVGIGFKLALVPFHMWTPDIYQGAPAPIAAFVATVSKGALVLLLLRYLHATDAAVGDTLRGLLAALAVASMLVGNLLALLQDNVRRILAYSSIGHLGYLLVAFQATGPGSANAATFYLVAYFVTMLGAFAVVTVTSKPGHEAETIGDYRGLFWQRPWLAGSFTLMLLSLAGIPLTAGFMGKFWVVAAGTSASAWAPVIVLVAASPIGLFYYLRIVLALYQPVPAVTVPAMRLAWGESVALGSLTILLVWFGVYPDYLLRMMGAAMASLGR